MTLGCMKQRFKAVILLFGMTVVMIGVQYSISQGRMSLRGRKDDSMSAHVLTRNVINDTATKNIIKDTVTVPPVMPLQFRKLNYTFNTALCGHKETFNDILCMEPPSYLENYKNPCWKSPTTQKLRCYPYFQLIGVDKSGSSDLFDRIAKHPDVYGNSGSLNKETQWWPWSKYGYFMLHDTKKKSFDDYLKFFDKSTAEIESKTDNNGYHYGITGDGTPMDAWDFTGWTQIPQNSGLKEPMFITPHLIRHISPNAKLIFIMRDPLERLYSDYFFIGLGGTTPEAFHMSVVKSIQYLEECLKQHSIRFCLYDRKMHFKWNKEARIHLGFYYIFIAEWLNVFPKKQFLFLRTEDYSADMKKILGTVHNFLQVRSLSSEEMINLGIDTKKRKHTTKRKSKKPMFNKTREILHNLYQPFNEKLAKLLHDDAYLWMS